jgi:dTDP-4-dehydrorhamnose reductase
LEPATSAQLARPAPRPAWSAIASERADVLPMPDWRDGLAGYLAARAGMMRA